jgi:hypothetical protein
MCNNECYVGWAGESRLLFLHPGGVWNTGHGDLSKELITGDAEGLLAQEVYNE